MPVDPAIIRSDDPEHRSDRYPDRINGAPPPQEGDVVVFVDNKLNREDKFFCNLIGYEFVTQMANDESVKINDHHHGWFSAWLHRVRLVARCSPVQPFKAYQIVTVVTKELIEEAKRDQFMLVVRCASGSIPVEREQANLIIENAKWRGVTGSDLHYVVVFSVPIHWSDEKFEAEVRNRFREA